MQISKEAQEHNQNFPSYEEIIEKGMAGQNKLLTEMLNAGVSLHYYDENDNYVKENPDGSIDILRKSEKLKITDHPQSVRDIARERANGTG